MADFSEIDFCKQRALRINRTFNSQDIPSADLAGATSLGCRFPVSHRAAAPGFILSRIEKQGGNKTSDLLASADAAIANNPGPTAWLHGCPIKAIEGNIALPFPAVEGEITNRLFRGASEIPQPGQTIGLGTVVGFRRLVVLPPGNLEYLDPGPLANHPVKYYYACVSSPNATEAFRLVYRDVSVPNTGIVPRYIWPGVPGQGTSVTHFVDGTNWHHIVGVSVVGIAPALTAHEALTLTPPVETAGIDQPVGVNGPDQTNRKFSYQPVGSAVNPDFNGSTTLDFEFASTRPTLTVFAQSEFFDMWGGFDTFTVNGATVNFSSATLPAAQFGLRPFIAEGGTEPSNFFDSGIFTLSSSPTEQQGVLYGPANMAGQLNVSTGVDELEFQIRTADNPGGVISTFTLPIPKDVGQTAWLECLVTIWSRHTGAL